MEKSKSQAVKEDFCLKLQNPLLLEFIELQEACYEHCQSIIQVGGEERNPFDVENGAKSGCILSP
jgi:hypothetical protein